MTQINFKSFSDELTKIAHATSLQKTAGPMSVIGRVARNVGDNLRHAVVDFRHPIANLRGGINYLKGDWTALPKGRFPKTRRWAARGMLFGDALGAPEALAKNDPTGEDRSRVERVGNWMGSAAGGIITAKRGISGALLGSAIGGVAGGRVGRAIKGRKPREQFRTQASAGVEANPPSGEPSAIPNTY